MKYPDQLAIASLAAVYERTHKITLCPPAIAYPTNVELSREDYEALERHRSEVESARAHEKHLQINADEWKT